MKIISGRQIGQKWSYNRNHNNILSTPYGVVRLRGFYSQCDKVNLIFVTIIEFHNLFCL